MDNMIVHEHRHDASHASRIHVGLWTYMVSAPSMKGVCCISLTRRSEEQHRQ